MFNCKAFVFSLSLFVGFIGHDNASYALGRDNPEIKKSYLSLKKRYKVYIFGDSLGDGIYAGVYNLWRKTRQYQVIKKSKSSTGLARPDYFDWPKKLKKILKKEKVDIAVVMMGINDGLVLKHKGRWVRFHSAKGYKLYRTRVRGFMRQLSSRNIPIYWYEIPVMKSRQLKKNARMINKIALEEAKHFNIKIIRTAHLFKSKRGAFSSYGRDIRGVKRKLRFRDGIHFTMPGNLKLAQLVVREIRKDVRYVQNQKVQNKIKVASASGAPSKMIVTAEETPAPLVPIKQEEKVADNVAVQETVKAVASTEEKKTVLTTATINLKPKQKSSGLTFVTKPAKDDKKGVSDVKTVIVKAEKVVAKVVVVPTPKIEVAAKTLTVSPIAVKQSQKAMETSSDEIVNVADVVKSGEQVEILPVKIALKAQEIRPTLTIRPEVKNVNFTKIEPLSAPIKKALSIKGAALVYCDTLPEYVGTRTDEPSNEDEDHVNYYIVMRHEYEAVPMFPFSRVMKKIPPLFPELEG